MLRCVRRRTDAVQAAVRAVWSRVSGSHSPRPSTRSPGSFIASTIRASTIDNPRRHVDTSWPQTCSLGASSATMFPARRSASRCSIGWGLAITSSVRAIGSASCHGSSARPPSRSTASRIHGPSTRGRRTRVRSTCRLAGEVLGQVGQQDFVQMIRLAGLHPMAVRMPSTNTQGFDLLEELRRDLPEQTRLTQTARGPGHGQKRSAKRGDAGGHRGAGVKRVGIETPVPIRLVDDSLHLGQPQPVQNRAQDGSGSAVGSFRKSVTRAPPLPSITVGCAGCGRARHCR